MNLFKSFRRVVWLAILSCLAWTSLSADPIRLDAIPDPLPSILIETPLEHYGSLDLTGLNTSQWKQLVAFHVTLLGESDARTRIDAMRNIIHFVRQYSDLVDFRAALDELYEIYRFKRDDTERIYALVALHAIGDEDTMRRLARNYRLERSRQVRKMIRTVVYDYFRHGVSA